MQNRCTRVNGLILLTNNSEGFVYGPVSNKTRVEGPPTGVNFNNVIDKTHGVRRYFVTVPIPHCCRHALIRFLIERRRLN